MARLKEVILNSLLAALVILSVVLSSRVWFPSESDLSGKPKNPSIQAAPPVTEAHMPNVFRPEQIWVQGSTGMVGLLPAGSEAYDKMWVRLEEILTGMRVIDAPFEVDQGPQGHEVMVSLSLPVSLTLAEWADYWHWDALSLRNPSIKIDRVHFYLGEPAAMFLSGPNPGFYRVGPVSQADRDDIVAMVHQLHSSLFEPYRSLAEPAVGRRVLPGVMAPAVDKVPVGRVSIQRPDDTAEVVRYFPDLSVVRQIDEKDARSFTDGQRLLRVLSTGVLEYRTANSEGLAPSLPKSLQTAREWVGSRGGWPQDVVLGDYMHQPGRTLLRFELRANGPYPVHADSAAVQVEVTADGSDLKAHRVTYLRRLPEMRFTFEGRYQPITAPEEALAEAVDKYPRELLFDRVREVYLAYYVKPPVQPEDEAWTIEPVWVFQVGEERLYIPAGRQE